MELLIAASNEISGVVVVKKATLTDSDPVCDSMSGLITEHWIIKPTATDATKLLCIRLFLIPMIYQCSRFEVLMSSHPSSLLEEPQQSRLRLKVPLPLWQSMQGRFCAF